MNRSRANDLPLPGFLIVGAMKAGTTTLYEDLRGIDGIYLLPEKEPNDLASERVETPRGRAEYLGKFSRAPRRAICGEASTAYTMRPKYDGVAERARMIAGPDLRVLYITRNPIERIVSHYRHLVGLGMESRPFDAAVLGDDTYVDFSRYGWQIAPWQREFGSDRVKVLSLEDYLGHRHDRLSELCRFLGVVPPAEAPSAHRNRTDDKHIPRPGSVASRVVKSSVYQYRLKPLLATGTRERIKRWVAPRSTPPDVVVSHDIEMEIRRRLEIDPDC